MDASQQADLPQPHRFLEILQTLSQFASGFTLVISSAALMGWALDQAWLKSGLMGTATMEIPTAVGLVASSVALWGWHQTRRNEAQASRRSHYWLVGASSIAATVIVLGCWELGQSMMALAGMPFAAINQQTLDAIASRAIAPETAFSMVLLGAALLCLARSRVYIAQLLSLLILSIAFLHVISHLQAITLLGGIGVGVRMALHTALGFMLLSLGILMAHADQGWMQEIASPNAGGLMARWLLPIAMVAPSALAWLIAIANRPLPESSIPALTLLSAVSTLGLATIIWWNSRNLNRLDQSHQHLEQMLQVEQQRNADLTASNDSLQQATQAREIAIAQEIARYRQVEHSLRQSEHQLQLITDALPVCISYVDADLRYQFANKTYENWFGLRRQDLYNRTLIEVIGEKAYGVVQPYLEQVLTGEYVSYEAQLPYLGGTRHISASLVPDWDPETETVKGYYALIQDISDRKQAEATIRHLNETLEQRVQERTQQLKEVNQDLEAFSYSVSHDLRAPLRAMQGMTQAFLEDFGDQLVPEGRTYIERVSTAAARLDGLIQDLLAYSQLGRAQLSLQRINVISVLAGILADHQAELQAVQAQITVEEPLPMVRAHHSVLAQVTSNLLTNAIKFVPPGQSPQIRIWGEAHHGYLRVWFEDNGIGIDPRHRARIFQVFERLHSIESYPGTGIGLAIVKRGIERMGGQAGVESCFGQGSRFWIEIPLA